MKAAVYRGPGAFAVEEIEAPEPGPGELLARVDACGVCGTDVKKIEKGLLSGPRVFGHEIAATVTKLGPGTSRFREGDRVVLHHHVPCGSCFYCAQRIYAQCETYKRNGTTAGFEPSGGGMAEYVRAMDWIVERGAIPIPDGVKPEEAAFVEPVNTCLKAVRAAGVAPGMSVLVVGQGPIGSILMQLARVAGASVMVTDGMPDRLELARELGADHAFDVREADVPREVRALTGGRGADRVLLAAMGQAPIDQAIEATRPGGAVMVFAATAPGEIAQVDFGRLAAAEKQLLTSYSASVDVQEEAARLVFTRQVRVAELVSHVLPLDEAPRAVALSQRPAPGVRKIVLRGGAA